MNEHDYAVIMAGGGGTRLWPVSRKNLPKQLLPLFGEETLFQGTVARLTDLFPAERILVVTVEEQAQAIKLQVPVIPDKNYLIEPSPRGTASVVGLAATVLKQRDPAAIMAVLPSDHFIRNRDLFHHLLSAAFAVAAEGFLVTLGIEPLSASTAYGYIHQGELLSDKFGYPAYKVRQFKEKPDEDTAQGFIREGGHSWNSGMFIWKVDRILAEIEEQLPVLSAALKKLGADWGTPKQEATLRVLWNDLKTETIDYAVMERAKRVAVLPTSGLGWNDVGSWDTLFDVLFPDPDGNVSARARHIALDTHNTLVYSHNADRLIVTIGLDDIILVDTADALLVCKADQAQKVREVVDRLKKQNQDRYL
jgi:mannose-1-phosphate guanylyltransferase